MTDLITFAKYAECQICGERYHVPQIDRWTSSYQAWCNGRKIDRCIAAHKESDPPVVQIENSKRFNNNEKEVEVSRNDWYGPAGIVLENIETPTE